MDSRCLLRLAPLFGASALLLACTDNGGGSDAGSGVGSTGSTHTSGSNSGPGSTGSTSDTGSTGPGCGTLQLADVAAGIGGFVVDGYGGQLSGAGGSGVGDVNGDGLDDVIIGAPKVDGRAYVVFGKADTNAVDLANVAAGTGGFALRGEAGEHSAGGEVSGAGDVNGDGLADVVTAAYSMDSNGANSGRVYVVFGKETTDPVELSDVAAGVGGFAMDGEAGDIAGDSLAAAGDVNADGLGDLIVGAAGASPNGVNSGRAYVVFGREDTTLIPLVEVAQGMGGFAIDGEVAWDLAGRFVNGAGDINGDGLDDVVLGTWTYEDAANSRRRYVVFGKTDTTLVSLSDVVAGTGGFAMDGDPGLEGMGGGRVDGAGDVNGDGLDDLMLGSIHTDINGRYAGRVYLVLGRADTDTVPLSEVASGSGGFVVDGEAAYDFVGTSVSGAGDQNGDGLADLLIGAGGAPEGAYAGRTYVVFGKTDNDPVSLTEIGAGSGGFAVDGEHEDDNSGYRVDDAGDVNGDGVADLLITAPGAEPNGPNSGRTYVVFGGDFSCEGR